MSEEVCMYSKYGFCKFKELCRRKTSKINVKIHHARTKLIAIKDTQKHAKDLSLQMGAGLAVTALTNILSSHHHL